MRAADSAGGNGGGGGAGGSGIDSGATMIEGTSCGAATIGGDGGGGGITAAGFGDAIFGCVIVGSAGGGSPRSVF